jgi:hypothetical protein
MKLHMTTSYVMHVSVTIYILHYFIHSAALHVVPRQCHIQSQHTHTYIYVTISGPYIFEHKHIQDTYLRIYITVATQSSYIWPKNMTVHTSKIWNFINIKLVSLMPESSYINLHCTYTLALHVWMYVYVPLTVLRLLDNGPSKAETWKV